MTEQRCVRTYDKDLHGYIIGSSDCSKELNSYLECGWKIILVTPKTMRGCKTC